MGCSQGKTTKPSAVVASTNSTDPMPTLFISTPRKQTTEVQQPKVEEGVVAPANDSEGKGAEVEEVEESFATVQAVSEDRPLSWKALRMFAMADKGPDGLLDANELAGDGSDKPFSEMLQDVLHGDVARLQSQAEWLESVKQFVLSDEAQASLFLGLCEMHLVEQKEQWPVRDEALQVFSMGDRNGDAQLDMNELTEICQSDEFTRAMMDLADDDEQAAGAFLSMYRSHVGNSSNTAEAYVAAKNAMDVLVDHGAARTPQCWWACY